MQTFLIFLQVAIFSLISILHFYWAFGGKWAFDDALPTNEKGEKILEPKAFECAVVGFGLILFALYYLQKGAFLNLPVPDWVMAYSGWIISGIFLLRAVGDFKYCGFFKRIKDTNFGKMDTKIYSPLCLVIGTIGVVLELMG